MGRWRVCTHRCLGGKRSSNCTHAKAAASKPFKYVPVIPKIKFPTRRHHFCKCLFNKQMHAFYFALGCVEMKAMASSTVRIFSCSASGMVIVNSSSSARQTWGKKRKKAQKRSRV